MIFWFVQEFFYRSQLKKGWFMEAKYTNFLEESDEKVLVFGSYTTFLAEKDEKVLDIWNFTAFFRGIRSENIDFLSSYKNFFKGIRSENVGFW